MCNRTISQVREWRSYIVSTSRRHVEPLASSFRSWRQDFTIRDARFPEWFGKVRSHLGAAIKIRQRLLLRSDDVENRDGNVLSRNGPFDLRVPCLIHMYIINMHRRNAKTGGHQPVPVHDDT